MIAQHQPHACKAKQQHCPGGGLGNSAGDGVARKNPQTAGLIAETVRKTEAQSVGCTDRGSDRLGKAVIRADAPRLATRTTYALTGPADRQVGIDTARGGDVDRLVPATAVRVEAESGELVAEFPDGGRWPLMEVFASLLTSLLLDSFKLLDPAPHTPRVTIDRLVVARRTWRTTADGCGLAGHTTETDRYLAVRRWRAALDLPERVFVKVGTEVKPCYVDLTGPLYAQSLCAMVDAAVKTGPGVAVVVTELLPDPARSWVTDAEGRGYVSELRLQLTDPASYRGEHG